MSRIRLSFPIRLLPAALSAALVMLGSAPLANAQYYDQNPSYGQAAPQDQYGATQDQYAQTDPPDRVARLAYISGDVEFAPAGESEWGSADVNRPMITGDRLLTGNGGRAALELGDAALRINDNSAFNFLDLNDTTTQVELTQGTLNLRVRRLGNGQTYEVDTPTVAFVADQPGTYRVDVAPSGNGAMVTVFEGTGTVYGENGVSREVDAGQSYRFDDSTLANVAVQGLPAPDDFDRFCEARDSRYANSISRRYVSRDVVGYDDLDQYGDWQSTPDYGEVWYPTQVATGWAPYRDGHWAWIDPWGWTWVDDEPWGYAPFHYGRWVYVSDRWGWVPGPVDVEPVYAPALVAFVGGAGFSASISIGGGYGEPVGWFPLGPSDVYVPPYRASQNYFTNINVTNIRNVYVNKTVINNYYSNYAAGRPYAGARQYAYRDNPRAFTAVPRTVFASAKPVMPAVLHVKPAALARATVAPIPHVAPTRASLAITPPKRPIAAPVARAFDRTVVARHAPPPRPVPFAAREKVIAKQGGAPIPVTQLQQMRQQHAKAQPERVRVVAAAPKPGTRAAAPARPGRQPVNAPREQPAMVQAPHRGAPQAPPNRPAPAPNPAQAAAANRQAQALRPGELPSARFAHPGRAQAQQQRPEQARQNAQSQAAQAQQNRQRAEQTGQQAEQARVQQETQARQRNQQTSSQQAQQRAEQERAQRSQQQAQEAQARQRDEQMRAQQERARQEQQQARQERVQQEEQQRAEQERARADQQRAEQARMQQERQQREEQMRSQQEQQQRAQMQMEQQREAQMRAQQQQKAQQQRAQQQRAQHAPPPPPKKHKDHDQQDNGGH